MKTCYLTKKQTKFLIDFLDDGLHRELEIRRDYVKEFSSTSALKILDNLSTDYEIKYMKNIL